MTPEQKVVMDKFIDALRPEAKELVDSVLSATMITTKDNYGAVMSFLGKLDNQITQKVFLWAMVKEGYPADTAIQIASLMGLSRE